MTDPNPNTENTILPDESIEKPQVVEPAPDLDAPTAIPASAESQHQTTEIKPHSAAPVEKLTAAGLRIGSQRDVADKSLSPSKPKAVRDAISNPILLDGEEKEQVEQAVVGSMEGLGDDVEQEIDAILGEMADLSLETALSGDPEEGIAELEIESRLKAMVSRVHGDNVFFELKGRFQGVCSARQFKEPPVSGAMLEVIIRGLNKDDGLYEVGVPGASVDVGDWSDLVEGAVVSVRVTGSNTGGLECTANSIRGFIPASQIDLFRVEQFGDYVNQKLQCVVMEVNPERKKLVLSRRALLEREREEQRAELLETIQVGDTRDGVVTKLMDFGAFVDIGGAEGLVHVSKMSWDRVAHPSEVFAEGQKVKVKIEKITEGGSKISLSYRDTLENPWDGITNKYPATSIVKGTVTRIAQFGAFVKLEPGVEGLIHISELAHHRVFAVKNVVNEGDSVEVQVLSVDPDAQKISLSLKATQSKPEPKAKESAEEQHDDEPARPLAVSKRSEPLKGGTSRKSGGEDIGLNW